MTSVPMPSARSGRDIFAAAVLAMGRRWSADKNLDLHSPAIVFAPHPDDEVLGCGGTIALKTAAGACVRIVIMTDGRTSHARLIDPGALVQMRRAEALDASRLLGLDPLSYTFLDIEDSRLADSVAPARAQVIELLQRFRPQQVFVPQRRDRLRDHVATFEIVTSAIRACSWRATVYEYPVWLWNSWPWTAELPRWRDALWDLPRLLRDGWELAFACSVRVDVRAVLRMKREALERYQSQMHRHGGDPAWPILADVAGGTFVESFFNGVELFRQSELGGV